MDRRQFLSSTAAIAGTVLISPELAAAESAGDASVTNPHARSAHMTTANELVVTYLAAWNETESKRRRELVARTWTESGSYVDAHRRGEGHAAIDSMIEK